ncbi:hypothetical protein Tco_1001049 [Tanacetum coccineum]
MYIMTSRPRTHIPSRPRLGCDRLVSRAKVIDNQSMAAPVITVSSDALEEIVTSVVSRVILFGTIPTKISIVPDMPTDLPTVPELPAVSPFLCSDDSESESADESPERYVSVRLHDDVIATTSPACISTPVIIASLAVRSHIRTTVRKSTLGLRPVMTPARSVALRKARRGALSLETSSSDTSSRSLSDLAPLSSSSTLPSRKRSRSSATSIPSIVHTAGVLSPTRANLLPPRKRYRGTSTIHLDESSDKGSPVMQTESDMDSDIQADVQTVTATAATVIIDRLGIEPVLARVEAGFEPGLAVIATEEEAKEEANAKIHP